MKVLTLLQVIILTIVFNAIQASGEEEIEKKTKVVACFALSRGRMEKDKSFKESMGESQGQEQFQRNLMFSLVNCYKTISQDQLSSIFMAIQGGASFDPMDKAYVNLLEYKDIEKTLSKEELVSAMGELNAVMNQLRQDQKAREEESEDEDYEGPAPPGQKGFSLLSIIQVFIGLNASIIKMLALDGYLGIGLLILVSFFFLRSLTTLCTKKKKANKTESQEIPAKATTTTEDKKE